MTIETKYNIGDEVWVYLWSFPFKAKIMSLEIIVRKERTYIYYNVGNGKDEFNSLRVIEKDIFPTKEELLKSL